MSLEAQLFCLVLTGHNQISSWLGSVWSPIFQRVKLFFLLLPMNVFLHYLLERVWVFLGKIQLLDCIDIVGTFPQHLDVLMNNNSIKQDLEFLLNLQSTGTASDTHNWGQSFNFCSASLSLSWQRKLWSPATPSITVLFQNHADLTQSASGPGMLPVAGLL